MRVTSTTGYFTLGQGLSSSYARLQDWQTKLATGQRINNYSDNPADAVTGVRLQAAEDGWAAWSRASDDAQKWAGIADTALQQSSTLLRQAQDLAVNAVNGSLNDSSRQALASQIRSIRDQLADTANTQQDGRAVFGGFQAGAVAFDSTSGSWQFTGDAGQVQRQIGASVTVTVNLDGRWVYGFDGTPGSDVFSTLDKLADAIESGDTDAVATQQKALSGGLDRVLQAVGQVGALENRITTAASQGSAVTDQLKSERSSVMDLDYGEAVLQLSQAQMAYQAALTATGRYANTPSLADFLS